MYAIQTARRVLTSLVIGGALAVAPGARAQEDEGSMLFRPEAAGEPGELIDMEWRARIAESVGCFVIGFDLPADVAEFVSVDVSGTASEHVSPLGLIFDPQFWGGGYRIGVRFINVGEVRPLAPGDDVLLVKGRFRIRADAETGEAVIKVRDVDFSGCSLVNPLLCGGFTMPVEIEGHGTFRVDPPSGPRPVGSLTCAQEGADVRLAWTATEDYDRVIVTRDGDVIEQLPGAAEAFVDRPLPGHTSYAVFGARGDATSLAAVCDLLVDVPRPAAIRDLACEREAEYVDIAWTNGADYDEITVFRNEQVIATLPGAAVSYRDTWDSDLFTVYTVRARREGTGTLPATCRLNEMSDVFMLWVEDARARPGDEDVAVRFLCTNPMEVQGFDISLRVDPAHARIRELTIDGTVSASSMADYFQYQRGVLDEGETRVGIAFDQTPPFGNLVPAGAEQHVLTLRVDIASDAPARIPVRLGGFGDPPGEVAMAAEGKNVWATTQDGTILVGDSPVPEVEGAEAVVRVEPPAAGDGGGAQSPSAAVQLLWRNPITYSTIRVERDGEPIAELDGDVTSWFDPDPGPGIHRYAVVAWQGDVASFPVTVTNRPDGLPGTFLRGDATANGRVDLTDAIVIIHHLWVGGALPPCLDAADANDDGRIEPTDPLAILHRLFLGGSELPPPGTERAWFDPTVDALACE